MIWIRIDTLKENYLYSLNNSVEFIYFFGKDFYDKYYVETNPSLKGFIRYVKNFKIEGFDVAILSKKNNLIKMSYGK